MAVRTLIIEDEPAAARRLEKLIHAIDPGFEILDKIDSVAGALQWFENNPNPDLVFLDIHLGDGLSFGIFEKLDLQCPVIFTTAYDEYAIKAFKLNSIDYLLKPVKPEELQFSIQKFLKQFQKENTSVPNFKALLESLKSDENKWKKRFIVHFGEKIKAINTEDIAYFIILEKNTFLVTHQNSSYGINYSLEQLEELLDPNKFFRVNRKFIIGFQSIENMFVWSRSRVKLQVKPAPPEDVIVSTDRTSRFKEWLNQ